MNLIKKSDFAEKLGVSRAAITQACKNKNLSLVADENGFIDLDAQTTIDYLSNRKPQSKPIERRAEKLISKIDPDIEIDDDTRGQIEQAGGAAMFKLLVDIKKAQVETELKKLKLAEQRGELVMKSELGDYCFSIIDALNRRLLNSPMQYVDRLIAMTEKDGKNARGKIVEMWTVEISKAIKSAVAEIEDVLK